MLKTSKVPKTRKSPRRINFIKNVQVDNANRYQPESKLHKFHQICMFRDPNTSKYSVRTIIFNENHEVIKVSEKEYTSDQCKSLITSNKTNEYKTYPTYDLDLVDYPNSDDLLKVQSDLLSNDNTYCGYLSLN
jgi:hypothetical protein